MSTNQSVNKDSAGFVGSVSQELRNEPEADESSSCFEAIDGRAMELQIQGKGSRLNNLIVRLLSHVRLNADNPS